MAMEDSGVNNQSGQPDADANQGATPAAKPAAQQTQTESAPAGAPEDVKQEGAGRMSQAKAFYRAMYAGEEKTPEDFGINLAPKQTGSGRGEADSELVARASYLETQVSELEKKLAESESFNKRLQADFENYKRRIERERDELQGTGAQKAIEGILPALDDMDRAKQSLSANQDPEVLMKNMNLVYDRFQKSFEQIGLKPLECLGQPFDPRQHEPVQEIETTEFADGAVMQELRKGYMYKDKVLRPSLVNVASNSSGTVTPKSPEAAKAAQHAETTELPIVDQAEVLKAAREQEAQQVYDITDTADEEVAEKIGE